MKRLLIALASLMLVPLALLAPSQALAQAASISIPQPPPQNGLICYNGFIYSFSSQNGTLYNYLLGGSTCGGNSSSGFAHAFHTVTDGPNSLQFKSAATALDLASVDVEGDARFLDKGDSDTVGGTATYFKAPGVDGEDAEGRYERNWRPFEGERTRAIITAPVTAITDNHGNTAISGLLSGGLEYQLAPNWSVTPRAAVGGATGSDQFGGDGVLGSLSLGSRYRVAQIGRGDLVIGNMIGYTADSLSHGQYYMLRNGVAYQFPIKQLVYGRQVSMRVSYVNTYVGGDPVGIHNYHELAMNFGVRMREQDVRNRFELLRIGLLYTHADSYNALTFTAGYRF